MNDDWEVELIKAREAADARNAEWSNAGLSIAVAAADGERSPSTSPMVLVRVSR